MVAVTEYSLQIFSVISCICFDRTLGLVGDGPDSRFNAERDTVFILFTKMNPGIGQIIQINDTFALEKSFFNSSNPTRFLIHGWLNNAFSSVNLQLRQAFQLKGDFNIFIVDWSSGAWESYWNVKARLPWVGRTIARYLEFLYRVAHLNFSTLYLLGFSFGSHIAGFAGKHLSERLKISVIVGMDAAGQGFESAAEENRLSTSDAEYVELIHTNAGYWGMKRNIGHADFYLNYGIVQPILCYNVCAHFASTKYFAESVNSLKGFYSIGCTHADDVVRGNCVESNASRVIMGGEPIDKAKRGVYFTPINSLAPYAVGKV